jgi:beta-lactamase superfamily II metal-dependent hydrolase
MIGGIRWWFEVLDVKQRRATIRRTSSGRAPVVAGRTAQREVMPGLTSASCSRGRAGA